MSCVRTMQHVFGGDVERFVNNIAITFVCVYVRLLLPSIIRPDRGQGNAYYYHVVLPLTTRRFYGPFGLRPRFTFIEDINES